VGHVAAALNDCPLSDHVLDKDRDRRNHRPRFVPPANRLLHITKSRPHFLCFIVVRQGYASYYVQPQTTTIIARLLHSNDIEELEEGHDY